MENVTTLWRKNMKTVKCSCNHKFQDKMYGQGNRMANETRAGQHRCTVCGTVHGSQSVTTQAEKASVKTATKEPAKVTKKVTKKEVNKKVNKNGKKKKGSLKGTKR